MEFCRDEFISVDEILELFRSDHSEKENRCSGSTESPSLSRNAIGRIVHDVWGSKGVRSKRVGKRGEKSTHGYINLRKKDKCSQDSQGELTVSLLDTVEAETELENWTAMRNGIDSLSFVRYEKWAFNGQRVCTEILVTSVNGDVAIEISSQGIKKSVEDLGIEEQLRDIDASKRVKVIAAFLDSSSLCAGVNCDAYKTLLLSSENNTVLSYTKIDDPHETPVQKIFSTKCRLLAPLMQSCESCSILRRNLTKCHIRRESSDDQSLRVNERYLSIERLVRKVANQRKLLKNAKERERMLQHKFEEQLITMEESDHADLVWMVENLDNKNELPPDMSILWDQQKKILETPSKKGYRWHPK